jgi:conjugal transfer pilus assembly protein TrbC
MLPLLIAALALIAATPALAQNQSKSPPPQLFVFVSTQMPRTSLVELAREAKELDAILVLRGTGKTDVFASSRTFVDSVNKECCENKGPAWIIHPAYFALYKVTAAPTFVLSQDQPPTQDPAPQFVKISGDMAIGNALKFFAQQASSPKLRQIASEIYRKN